ncbi:hypothetical protein B0H16DRAFT_1821696 [Mycena metata]|uniref:Uncharacterized protein n=1 Tax=Mycena metata TaxID=1033252 RepID=A0AAD7JA56_9AGAR|nr:hypothetical protein B0H16DRAFT_1821696 [Mycena metata]
MPTHHITVLLPPAWGHVVSYLHIATQMLKKDTTLGITIVTSALVDCKFLVWFSPGLAFMTTHLTDYDFGAIAEEIHADESRRENRTKEVILEQVGTAWNGSDKLSGVVIKFPGVPDMYNYERLAYATGPPPPGTCLEPVAIPFCCQFYKERGQELYAVGMQAHELCWDQTHPIPLSNETIKSFLDKAVSEHGP